MRPRKEVLVLVGTAVVLVGAGYWYGTGDEATPVNTVVQNEPIRTRDQPPLPLTGKRGPRKQVETSDEVAPETPKRTTAKVMENEQSKRKPGEKVSPKKKDEPAV